MQTFPREQAQAFLDDGWWSGSAWDDHLRRHAAETPD